MAAEKKAPKRLGASRPKKSVANMLKEVFLEQYKIGVYKYMNVYDITDMYLYK